MRMAPHDSVDVRQIDRDYIQPVIFPGGESPDEHLAPIGCSSEKLCEVVEASDEIDVDLEPIPGEHADHRLAMSVNKVKNDVDQAVVNASIGDSTVEVEADGTSWSKHPGETREVPRGIDVVPARCAAAREPLHHDCRSVSQVASHGGRCNRSHG